MVIHNYHETGRKWNISSECVWEYTEDVSEEEPNSEDHMGACSVSGQREDLLRSLHFPDV